MTHKERTSTLLLAAMGLVAGIALVEGLVRVLNLGVEMTYTPNPAYGWSLPHQWVGQSRVNGVQVAVNSRGLRDREYAYEKPEGAFRILVLGDSFTEALQVAMDKSFPKQMEELLNSGAYAGRRAVQVINAGTSGYGTDNELLFFRHEGYKYQPDLVVLAFCICNDVRSNWYKLENLDAGGFRKPYFIPAPDGLAVQGNPLFSSSDFLTQMKMGLARYLRLYTFLRQAADRWRNRATTEAVGMPLDFGIYRATYPDIWKEAWAVTKALLTTMATEVRQHGAELFVVIIPAQVQVHTQYWEKAIERYTQMSHETWDLEHPNRLLRRIFEEANISYIDLLPKFREHVRATRHELYIPSDGHWNTEGHSVAAHAIVEELLVQNFLKRETGVTAQ